MAHLEDSAIITQSKKENSLFSLFGQQKIQALQEKLVAATGLSFYVIDYRGEAISNHTIHNQFCRGRKKNEPFCSQCSMLFAMSAAKAAILNKPYIFRCDKNLLSTAIPIIINNQYLGALVGGQVRCEDAEGKVPDETQGSSFDPAGDYTYEEIPVISYERFNAICELAYFLINEMAAKETSQIRIAQLEHKDVHLKDLRKKNSDLRHTISQLEIENLKFDLMPHFMINLFITASNFAVLEDAAHTEEVLTSSISILRYYLKYTKENIFLGKELEQVDLYLAIIKKQYVNRFDYRIQCDEELLQRKIPATTLFPFLEYILYFGMFSRNFKGHLFIDGEVSSHGFTIAMQMVNEFDHTAGKKEQDSALFEESDLMSQIDNAKKRLDYLYKASCSVTVQPDYITIDIPESAE